MKFAHDLVCNCSPFMDVHAAATEQPIQRIAEAVALLPVEYVELQLG